MRHIFVGATPFLFFLVNRLFTFFENQNPQIILPYSWGLLSAKYANFLAACLKEHALSMYAFGKASKKAPKVRSFCTVS